MDAAQPIAQSENTAAFLAGRLRHRLSPEDAEHLESIVGQPRLLVDRERLLTRGETTDQAHLLVEGFMFSAIEKDGERFIVAVHVPGDFVDLHAFALRRLDHHLVAAGPARVSAVSHADLDKVLAERPVLAEALWAATLLEAAIHRRWIHNLEALDAPRRIAHVFAELHCRLAMIGKNVTRTLRTPFTQTDLADMCGVSAIHANRAVGRLREMGLAEIRRGDLYTGDWTALEKYAGFDPAYLYSYDGALLSP